MSNTNSSSHQISLTQAIELTSRYRDNRISVLKDIYSEANILPICETFDKDAFSPLFNNSNCKSIRIYYGMSSNLEMHAVIVGVDAEGRDMLPQNNLTGEDDGVILEESQRCPPTCPEPSPLNEP